MLAKYLLLAPTMIMAAFLALGMPSVMTDEENKSPAKLQNQGGPAKPQ